MDLPLIFLIVIIIIIFIVVLILLFAIKPDVVVAGTSTGIVNTTHCTNNNLPDLSNDLCCVIFGTLTGNKYLSNLNLVVSLTPTNYLDVCTGFCTQGYDSSISMCNGNITQDNIQFQNCVNASNPTLPDANGNTCSDVSRPIAVTNSNYLYPFATGFTLCPTTSLCAVQI
jgi:hypothetical protein